MKHYKTAVFGATVLAAGIAEMLGDSAIIIEKSESVAIDYTSCINMPLSEIRECKTEQTKNFLKDITTRNLIDETGKVHVFPIAGICAKRFLKGNTLLSTDVISVERKNDAYEITLFNIDGFTVISAEHIIDTTATGILGINADELDFKKYLNAAIYGSCNCNSILFKGRFENEFVYSVPVDKNISYSEAVNLLHKNWQKLSENDLKNFELTAIAPQFAYIFDSPVEFYIDTNYLFKPSASQKNLGEAFEEGIYASELFV